MATHSSILTWRIPGTEEPGSLWGRKESDVTGHSHKEGWSSLSTRTSCNEFNKAFLCSQSNFPFYCLPVPWKFPWGTLKAKSHLNLFPFLQEQPYISSLCDGCLSSGGWKSHIHKNAKEKAIYISLSHTHCQIQFPQHNNKLYHFLSMCLLPKHYAKFLTYIISFNPGNNSEILDILVPFFRWDNWALEERYCFPRSKASKGHMYTCG